MKFLRNPYDNRKPVTNPSFFSDRHGDVVRIMKQISSQSCSIYGEPRIGKTSLLHYLAHPQGARQHSEIRPYLGNPENYLFVLIELQSLPVRNALGLWRYLFDRLAEEANKAGCENEKMRTYYRECRELRDEYEVQFGLEQYLKAFTGRIVLLFDDFEVIVNDFDLDHTLSSTQKLRALTQSADLQDKVNYIIMSTDSVEQLFAKRGLEKVTSPLFNILLELGSLGLLDEEGAYRLVREPLCELGVEAPEFTEQDVHLVLQLAGRHPDLIKISSSYLFEAKLQGKVSYSQVQQAIEHDSHLRWLMSRLWERVEEVETREGLALCDTLRSIAKGEASAELRSINELEERGLIDKSTAKPQVFSSIFRDFIRGQNVANKEIGSLSPLQGIKLEPTSRSVHLNGSTTKLTTLEFKLLQALANNARHTCSRSELSRILWGDNPPASADALEQLMKRLRKKIEIDPEKPQLLLSIRGQGYLLRNSEVTVVN